MKLGDLVASYADLLPTCDRLCRDHPAAGAGLPPAVETF